MTYLNSVHSTVIFWNFLPQIMAVWSITSKLTTLREKKQTVVLPTGLTGKQRFFEMPLIDWKVIELILKHTFQHLNLPCKIYIFTRKLWYYIKDWEDPHQTDNSGYLWEESWRRWQKVNEKLCFLFCVIWMFYNKNKHL